MTAVVPDRQPDGAAGGSAPWLFGLALALAGEEADEERAVTELLAEAGQRCRELEGAYGRGLVLLGEYPDDPKVKKTVRLLVKALRRAPRPAAPWPP